MSQRVPRRHARHIEAVLQRHGFVLRSQRGSHRKWRHPSTGHVVIVPDHGKRPLPIGTLRAIMSGSGLPTEAWTVR